MDREQERFRFWVYTGIIVVIAVFVLSIIIGGVILYCGPIERLGNFGDFFGFFGGVVSALGFGAVIYQLQRQHIDSKETETRHKVILDKQQQLFEQNAKIQLFEKRYELRQEFFEIFESWNKSTDPDCQKIVRKAQDLALKANFLFSNVPLIEVIARYLDISKELETAVTNFNKSQDPIEKRRESANIVSLLKNLAEIGNQAQVLMGEQLRIKIDGFNQPFQAQQSRNNSQEEIPKIDTQGSHQ